MIRLTILLALIATPALADPCKAIPDRGPMPSYLREGVPFRGPVGYVGDGDSICVAVRPGDLVEVRLADWFAPELHAPGGAEAKSAMERIAKGRQATCIPQRGHNGSIRSYDRVIATCRIDGVPLSTLMRRSGIRQGGNGYGR